METKIGLSEVQAWLEDYIRSVIDIPDGPFPAEERFDNLGIDSVEATIMAGMIEERFTLQVEMSELLENSDVKALSAHLAKRLDSAE